MKMKCENESLVLKMNQTNPKPLITHLSLFVYNLLGLRTEEAEEAYSKNKKPFGFFRCFPFFGFFFLFAFSLFAIVIIILFDI